LEGTNLKKKLSAICFDADGVVVYPQMQFSKYLNEEYGISPEMTRGFFRGVFNDCLVGKADLNEVLPPYLREWNWKGSVDQFIATWLERDHVVDARLINVIQQLRKKGFLCCLTTSQERNRAQYMKTRMGFQEAFDHLFFSCELGCQKPDHSYFQYIESTLTLKTQSILLLDDMEKNVTAAREFGWNAEIYTEFGKFENILQIYGLDVSI
jgi:putative hydrolase of the HAD superfamily